MSTRAISFCALILAASLLSGCGSGGDSTTALPSSALNTFEQELAGTYALENFTVIEPGVGGFDAEDFEAFEGTMRLGEDGFARLQMELCEDAAAEPEICDRRFTWHADAGWLYLECIDTTGGDAWAVWEQAGMGRVNTEFREPTNHPECEHLLLEDGFEAFTWRRVD